MVSEPVAVAVEVHDDGAVQETVEHRGGHGRVAEDFTPPADAAVACDDDRRFHVSLGDDLEERGCAFGLEWQVSEFIDD